METIDGFHFDKAKGFGLFLKKDLKERWVKLLVNEKVFLLPEIQQTFYHRFFAADFGNFDFSFLFFNFLREGVKK